ncbi:MAG: hypothetical protein M0R33_15210 [Methylomonas sp.]|uniref:hypothetical protein n=1 Tax=Methylomonas sp. TaxID=418 RepID=UPI0025F81009|nr:hypothetical protein [Methylomonas sp.]MCK9607790.1 hypothetical protein [Methylomonas sp.]
MDNIIAHQNAFFCSGEQIVVDTNLLIARDFAQHFTAKMQMSMPSHTRIAAGGNQRDGVLQIPKKPWKIVVI